MNAVDARNQLCRFLLEKHGPLMSGADLYRALGYSSSPAFTRGMSQGTVGVHVFKLPGRRGTFALTSEVASWLSEHGNSTSIPVFEHSESQKSQRQTDELTASS